MHPYKKVILSPEHVDDLLIVIFTESQRKLDCVPKELIIDLDTTDDPLHGEQEGRFLFLSLSFQLSSTSAMFYEFYGMNR